jgi:hypothetical protein
MNATVLTQMLQKEILRHDFDFFVDEPPSIAQGGKGVVVSGCPACRNRMQTMNQFRTHLAEGVIPALIRGLAAESRHGS